MKGQTPGVIASIRQRLLNISRDRKADFQLILTQYVIERILYRISQSPYRNQLILKGAQLFRIWSGDDFRPTRDLDLLGSGDSSPELIQKIFETVCNNEAFQDGLILDSDSIIVSNIRDDQAYGGQRVKFIALLGRAKIDVQIDIGFGDIITPGPIEVEYPTFLDMPKPVVLSYTPETVIAEKFEAMVDLGFQNSRMKDFFDIWVLLKNFEFIGDTLATAIKRTFHRRQTEIPESEPLAFTLEFSEDRQKVIQWGAFLRKNKLSSKAGTLADTIQQIRLFLSEPIQAASRNDTFTKHWKPGNCWQNQEQ